jgi:hypothetical protein
MRKLLLFLVVAIFSINVKAAYIVDFTEEDLLGTWDVVERIGDLSSIGWSAPWDDIQQFIFNDGKYSYITYIHPTYNDLSYYALAGFFVTNNQILHIVYPHDFPNGNKSTPVSFYKMKITQYDGQGNMCLETLKGGGTIILKKRNEENASVRSLVNTPNGNGSIYNLNGNKISSYEEGINIIKESDGSTSKVLVK